MIKDFILMIIIAFYFYGIITRLILTGNVIKSLLWFIYKID